MLMKKIIAALLLVSCVGIAVVAQERGRGQAPAAPPKARAGHPAGKLILWGDVALFVAPGQPDNCIQTNRYKRGQRLGFRMAAIDGGTGEPENTAMLTAHLQVGGKTIDVPMRFRGAPDPAQPAPQPNGYTRPITNLWTGFWRVPDDAPIGTLTYTVTATDQFGRTAAFEPFSYDTSQLTIVQ
jgi:hypothetical protein